MNKLVDLIRRKKWYHEVTRKHSTPFDWYLCVEAVGNHEKEIGVKIDPSAILYYDHQYIYSELLLNQLFDFYENMYENNKHLFFELAEKTEARCNKLIEVSNSVNLENKEDQLLLLRIVRSNKVFWPVVDTFPEWLMGKADIGFQPPIKQNYVTKYYQDFCKILKEISKKDNCDIELLAESDEKIKSMIDEFVSNYYWMGYFHLLGNEMNKKKLIEEIKNNIDKIVDNKEENSSSDETEDIRLLRYYSFLATHMPESQMYHGAHLMKLFRILSDRTHIPVEIFRFMTFYEIESVIQGEYNIDINKVKKRIDGFAIVRDEDGKTHFIDSDSYPDFFDKIGKLKFINDLAEKKSEIKGISACKGKISGTARIIVTKADFYKVQKGDIIVAPETTPDYIPIMSKASAFVTNEGGLSSHAAIVSREMNKPCIVGTKNATKLLIDGDLIEVDADNGIVRKL